MPAGVEKMGVVQSKERSLMNMIKTEKSIETLTKEIATLDSAELHDLTNWLSIVSNQYKRSLGDDIVPLE